MHLTSDSRNPTLEVLEYQLLKEVERQVPDDNLQLDNEPRRLFDLGDSEGVNESERILTKLCRRSFLRLWSQTNIYTDEGFKDGKGATKELCDALVIFGNDVIVFSDKHIKFQAGKELKIAWPRWYKRAVLDSCRQLHGAKSWLKRFPERAFLDPKCLRKLPLLVPTGEVVRFHLIAVTRGSREAALAAQGEEGLGSFGVCSSLEGDAHLTAPFFIGLPEPSKQFVHVFDEVTIELLMSEFDTAIDFIDYLKAREALLARRGTNVTAFGEEQLMAAYLRTMDESGTRHVFFNIPQGEPLPEMVIFDGSHYEGLNVDPGYKRKKLADKISYEWDALIERFVECGDPSLHERYVDQTALETEVGLRLLASESRFRRRQLAESFIGALRRVKPGDRLGRLVYGGVADETAFIFVIVPKRANESYSEYRQYRMSILHAYVQTARLKAQLATTFVGIAFDNPHKDYKGGSEDLFVLSKEEWTEEDLAELERNRKELGLWGPAMELWHYRQDEFPQAAQAVAIRRMEADNRKPVPSRSVEARKAVKSRRKIQQQSKRRNRRR